MLHTLDLLLHNTTTRFALVCLGRETGEHGAFGGARIGVLPLLADLVKAGSRRRWLPAPHLSTPQPEQVTDRVTTLQAGAQHRLRLVELLGAQIGLEHSVLEHFPLGMAATYAGELIEAWLGEERFHTSDCLAIC